MATSAITGLTKEQQEQYNRQNVRNVGNFLGAAGKAVYPFIDPTDPLNYLGLFGKAGKMIAVGGTAMTPRDAEAVVGARFRHTGIPTNVPMYGKAFEISDQFSSLNPSAVERLTQLFGGGGKLKEILNHPSLYRDYPEIANLDVKTLGLFSDPGTRAAYGNGTVYLPRTKETASPEALKQLQSSLLHEVQHAIQELDKMPRGASPTNFLPENIAQSMKAANNSEDLAKKTLYDHITAKYNGAIDWGDVLFKTKKFTQTVEGDKDTLALLNQYEYAKKLRSKLSDKMSAAQETYERVAGEAQARAVQKRFENPSEYERPFTESYDKGLLDLQRSPLDVSID